ncbi:protein tyrosine phosphatase type IVA 3 isoform X1 [Diceros bicornis minor]|uniref:protein tyrosine phosphatase type IVA 3 isoform X1 n=1 Tax=Diceros bicornis minor TaxID=77932 RepID=UPI0026F044F3|nr:protein tyrosine phosphatase type IVA 3 isoform X1 [Diceros bicornis minor]
MALGSPFQTTAGRGRGQRPGKPPAVLLSPPTLPAAGPGPWCLDSPPGWLCARPSCPLQLWPPAVTGPWGLSCPLRAPEPGPAREGGPPGRFPGAGCPARPQTRVPAPPRLPEPPWEAGPRRDLSGAPSPAPPPRPRTIYGRRAGPGPLTRAGGGDKAGRGAAAAGLQDSGRPCLLQTSLGFMERASGGSSEYCRAQHRCRRRACC